MSNHGFCFFQFIHCLKWYARSFVPSLRPIRLPTSIPSRENWYYARPVTFYSYACVNAHFFTAFNIVVTFSMESNSVNCSYDRCVQLKFISSTIMACTLKKQTSLSLHLLFSFRTWTMILVSFNCIVCPSRRGDKHTLSAHHLCMNRKTIGIFQ